MGRAESWKPETGPGRRDGDRETTRETVNEEPANGAGGAGEPGAVGRESVSGDGAGLGLGLESPELGENSRRPKAAPRTPSITSENPKAILRRGEPQGDTKADLKGGARGPKEAEGWVRWSP